uniref:Mono(ADP-ribosyl)transferase n=1 Tax=Cryptomonas curvata TaxID=233186 RepID=A0A7S0QU27_9CRYP|mmetsp:Transcript_52824/g.110243  ORF Transcript_52824/g.110243 Transcript_52824/m.110243 type:complete len:342 (+) Transcript_52824:2704-3729(+)
MRPRAESTWQPQALNSSKEALTAVPPEAIFPRDTRQPKHLFVSARPVHEDRRLAAAAREISPPSYGVSRCTLLEGPAAGGVIPTLEDGRDGWRATRHLSDILERPIHKPLQSYAEFLPSKGCAEYVRCECATALPKIARLVDILVREGQAVATSILDLGHGRGLTPPQVFAIVCFTMDLRPFGAAPDENFYAALNAGLQRRNPRLLEQLAGYLHFFFSGLRNLPREPEDLFFRGVPVNTLQTVQEHYRAGVTVVWSGVTSTSRREEVALQFATDDDGEGIVFRISAFSAVSVESFSIYPEAEVFLEPNFKATVARPLYQDPAHPGFLFVDLVESRSAGYVF